MFAEAVSYLVLVGASFYGLYALTPADQPYGYLAAAFCFIHGLISLVRTIQGSEDCARSYFVSMAIVEVLPLPLANIEFYRQTSQCGLAFIHGISLILLLYDVMGSLGDDGDRATDTVKDLTLVGNIISGTYLGIQEEKYFHVGAAASAGIARFGSHLVGYFLPSAESHVDTLSRAAIIGLMTYSLTSK
ncbi:GH16031 [Drosophila grimshawi]|uniref:GH16031 n=2 Tax=Drosophila grimshawi TaxID=7222 RepID=B4J2R2_DROGR|nr:GH16031 [Drosophila grimshawi]